MASLSGQAFATHSLRGAQTDYSILNAGFERAILSFNRWLSPI